MWGLSVGPQCLYTHSWPSSQWLDHLSNSSPLSTPEIDITCWDADPVPEEEEGFEGGD